MDDSELKIGHCVQAFRREHSQHFLSVCLVPSIVLITLTWVNLLIPQ